MARGATLQIENLGTKTLQKGQVSKDILAVAQADYLTVLRGIAAQEVAAQIRIGNKPTNILVDNKEGKPITEATFSIKVYFIDAALIRRAMIDAWREMQMLSRHVTGRSAAAYEIWTAGRAGDKPYVSTPGAIQLGDLKSGVGLMLVGPMVAHTRKYRFLDKAGKVNRRTSRAKKYKNSATPVTVRRSTQEFVVGRLKRQYPALNIQEVWITVPDLNPGGKTSVTKIPAIYIGAKYKGRI